MIVKWLKFLISDEKKRLVLGIRTRDLTRGLQWSFKYLIISTDL